MLIIEVRILDRCKEVKETVLDANDMAALSDNNKALQKILGKMEEGIWSDREKTVMRINSEKQIKKRTALTKEETFLQ